MVGPSSQNPISGTVSSLFCLWYYRYVLTLFGCLCVDRVVDDARSVHDDAVDDINDMSTCVAATDTEQVNCHCASSLTQQTSSTDTGSVCHHVTAIQLPVSGVDIQQEQPDDSSDTNDSKPQDRPGLQYGELALILRLQRDMAAMQLQLSNLQDAVRAANTTLQLLLQRAFDSQS